MPKAALTLAVMAWWSHPVVPSATTADPTVRPSASTAGVGVKPFELDHHTGTPDTTRKTVSHTNSALAAHMPARDDDRCAASPVPGFRRGASQSHASAPSPTAVATAGQMKLLARK